MAGNATQVYGSPWGAAQVGQGMGQVWDGEWGRKGQVWDREWGRVAASPGNGSALLGLLSLCEKTKAGSLLLKLAQNLALDASL